MPTRLSAEEWAERAAKADLSVNDFMAAIRVNDQYEAQLHSERSLSGEDKEKIRSTIGSFNGGVLDITPADILVKAGVHRNIGASVYVRRQLKLLAPNKTA